MALPNVFDQKVSAELVSRIEKLNAQSQALWGKMNVAQMLAHCNVTYALDAGKISSKNNFFMKLMLKAFVKNIVVNEKPYPKNSRTAPIFLISDEKIFESEKQKLIANIQSTQSKGASHYEGRLSDSFGKLSSVEWNNMFYKHLNHHLSQFGV